MSTGDRICMHRTVLYRSPSRLVLQYADGTRSEFTEPEQIRWLLAEQNALVSLNKKTHYFSELNQTDFSISLELLTP